ncbi:membrane protein insertion efficiency factor YidD [Hazenella sp. IB182357]|uniref:Putative membrane protein insertion efficiency factor n=1 Tax=Polycladospora coralii TaxID=2771432 RepID=A0A926NB09_9BACL|nr:membrane protein insertion efficiency factor YidD [Polycladospora coralii]MBD1371975.1 membrane protein insertion efficiency factor YidD [Polycladospora coralii]MBS7530479.1 membrane protein insertion efficiency factor YidD [Polycladospora coralii]
MLKASAIGVIRFYRRYISPYTPPTCRFVPTCSQYGLTAIERHGFFVGSWYTFVRILKCQPFHPGGIDHVPEKNK